MSRLVALVATFTASLAVVDLSRMGDALDPQTIGTAINLGAFTLVAWLVRHTFTHTIPRLAKDFREVLDQVSGDYNVTLEKYRADCSAEREKLFAVIERDRQDLREALALERRKG